MDREIDALSVELVETRRLVAVSLERGNGTAEIRYEQRLLEAKTTLRELHRQSENLRVRLSLKLR